MHFSKNSGLWLVRMPLLLLVAFATAQVSQAQESLPNQLAGTWRVTRMLPTGAPGCWDGARSLVGTTITYRAEAMRWRGGEVPLTGITTRTLSADSFERESTNTLGAPVKFADLNIQAPRVMEVDIQHADADVTGSTTEVPGDSVLLAGRSTIVVSACGSFFEATRVIGLSYRTPPQATVAENHNPAPPKQTSLNMSLQKR